MIIDFHTHIFPADVRDNREKFFHSEPAFKLLYQSAKSRLIGAAELLTAMDENAVDKSVIFGFPWRNPAVFKLHNDYIMATVQKYPDRFIGLACFEPGVKKTVAEAERCLAAGISGIGELAFYQTGIDELAIERLAPIMDMCAKRGLPVLIHTNEPVGHAYHGKTQITLAQIYRLINRFPENKIVLAHWGGGLFFFGLMKKEVKESFRNVYFDTAATPFLYDAEIYKIAEKIVGIDKILFGSDFPLLPPARYFIEMEQAGLTEIQRKKIGGENAGQLLTSSEKP
ncbi:MAG: amidohydrolase [Deltaproteobacteria bacterium]|nr:amidohydrolase [Deltaproteobacteria bacterium]